MNKTFKRAVSSVLASAMAFSSVTVATVSTTLPFTATQAFAAETTTVASWKSGDADKEMYKAKKTKNSVSVYEGGTQS